MPRKHVPVRSCVACREARPKADLMRIVRMPEGGLAVDAAGRAPGRGAYVCRRDGCIEQALRRGGLQRALGGQPSPRLEEDMRESVARADERAKDAGQHERG